MVYDSLNAADVTDPIEVFVGYPSWTEGQKVWSQPADPGFVTLDALKDVHVVTRYRPEWALVGPLNLGFSATNTLTTITFAAVGGATTAAGTNVHSIFSHNSILYDALYTTLVADTPATVATAVALAITNAGVSGVTASATGDVVAVVGAPLVAVNVGGSGQAHKEVARFRRSLQVSAWVSSPWARFQIEDAIVSTLGAVDTCWYTMPDYGKVLVLPSNGGFNDDSQSSYNLYIGHFIYTMEYGVIQRAAAAQIGDIDVTLVENAERTTNFIVP